MKLTEQLAKRVREFHFGGNWIASSLKDQLADVDWQQATRQVYDFHSIATLVYHLNYYVSAVVPAFQGGPLEANDKYSFNLPSIRSQQGWEELLGKTWTDAENLASLIEQLPENELWEDFADKKYGSYYKNILGIIEHSHYHLGQIALIKKLVLHAEKRSP